MVTPNIKLSVITVNYNNVVGLKQTMDSVLEQLNDNIEYIVIDGGSKDGSKELIAANSNKLAFWVSEKDRGVYHAMNKGIERASGQYCLFLNSGDHFYHHTILVNIMEQLDGTPIIYGDLYLIANETKSWTGVYPAKLSFDHFVTGSLPHPSSFILRSLFDEIGGYEESLQICADWKFFIDAVCSCNVSYKKIDATIASFYLNGISSTGNSETIIQREKQQLLWRDYPLYMETYQKLQALKQFRHNRYINALARLLSGMGLLKNTH